MKKLFLLAYAFVLLVPAVALADNKNVEWEVLFDGANLDAFDMTELKDIWVITDKGELHPVKPGPTIFTKQRYTDFVLELDFRMGPKAMANSGVFVHVHDTKREVDTGLEVQILDNGDYGVPFTALNANGALYELVQPRIDANKPIGQWNHYRIVSDGSQITVDLNGIEVVRADLSKWTKARQTPTGEQIKFAYPIGALPKEGFIGLQNYAAAPVWFKNIRLQRLSNRKSKYTGNEPIDRVLSLDRSGNVVTPKSQKR